MVIYERPMGQGPLLAVGADGSYRFYGETDAERDENRRKAAAQQPEICGLIARIESLKEQLPEEDRHV